MHLTLLMVEYIFLHFLLNKRACSPKKNSPFLINCDGDKRQEKIPFENASISNLTQFHQHHKNNRRCYKNS